MTVPYMTIAELRKIINDTTLDPHGKVFGTNYDDERCEDYEFFITEATIKNGDLILK